MGVLVVVRWKGGHSFLSHFLSEKKKKNKFKIEHFKLQPLNLLQWKSKPIWWPQNYPPPSPLWESADLLDQMSPRIVSPHPLTLPAAACGPRIGSCSGAFWRPGRSHRPLVGLVTQAELQGRSLRPTVWEHSEHLQCPTSLAWPTSSEPPGRLPDSLWCVTLSKDWGTWPLGPWHWGYCFHTAHSVTLASVWLLPTAHNPRHSTLVHV